MKVERWGKGCGLRGGKEREGITDYYKKVRDLWGLT